MTDKIKSIISEIRAPATYNGEDFGIRGNLSIVVRMRNKLYSGVFEGIAAYSCERGLRMSESNCGHLLELAFRSCNLCYHAFVDKGRFDFEEVYRPVEEEFERAIELHPPLKNPYEAFEAIDEEVDELKQAVRHGTDKQVQAEAIQVAAMCVRAIYDLYNSEYDET